MDTKDLNRIIDFSIDAHRNVNQKYDGLPYYIHLMNVDYYVQLFKHLLPTENDIFLARGGAWTHDLIEDTGLTFNNVRKITGDEIANISFYCTNHRGKTRTERANTDYYEGIKIDHIILFVKICDRLANTAHSFLYGNKCMFETYKEEYQHFKDELYLVDNEKYNEMWNYLENIEIYAKPYIPYFKDIITFDENTIHRINLPKLIPFELYHELYLKGIIRKQNLRKNTYYFGTCRNAEVAFWNGYEFTYMRTKFGSIFPENIKHMEDDNNYDVFIPLKKVEPNDNQRINF